MKELLSYVASLLVSDRERLSVTEHDAGNGKKFIISVAGHDAKNLIGKEGRTIKAIRSLVSMASINRGIKSKIPVEIVDE